MDNAIAVLRKHGYFPPRKISLTVLDNQGTGKSDDLGYVSSGDLSPGTSPTCNVFLTKEGRKFGATDVQFILAHEAVHCMQHAFYANQAQQ